MGVRRAIAANNCANTGARLSPAVHSRTPRPFNHQFNQDHGILVRQSDPLTRRTAKSQSIPNTILGTDIDLQECRLDPGAVSYRELRAYGGLSGAICGRAGVAKMEHHPLWAFPQFSMAEMTGKERANR